MFGDLIKQNKIDPKYANLRGLLTKAAAQKSDYDYKGTEAGKDEARRWLRDAGNFLRNVKEILTR